MSQSATLQLCGLCTAATKVSGPKQRLPAVWGPGPGLTWRPGLQPPAGFQEKVPCCFEYSKSAQGPLLADGQTPSPRPLLGSLRSQETQRARTHARRLSGWNLAEWVESSLLSRRRDPARSGEPRAAPRNCSERLVGNIWLVPLLCARRCLLLGACVDERGGGTAG